MTGPLQLGVFLSGGGRTLANLIEHRDSHGLPIEIKHVLASRGDAGGLTIARRAGIATTVVIKSRHDDAGYQRAMFDPCRDAGCDVVVMAGYLKHVLIPDDFRGRVINIHPSLLPAFGGRGMYGLRVHAAVIERGCKVSGCTVHLVDNVYDNGRILDQSVCMVHTDDTAESLAARVFDLEKQLLPRRFAKLAVVIVESTTRAQRSGFCQKSIHRFEARTSSLGFQPISYTQVGDSGV